MPSIWDLIAEREAAANASAQHLREQIATLSAELALTETELAELAITRKTLTALSGEPDTAVPADPTPADVSVTDATIAGTAYQQILAVFATTADPMRARDVCLALGLGVTPKDTEGIRARLKRLTARHILLETEPGLFTPAPATVTV